MRDFLKALLTARKVVSAQNKVGSALNMFTKAYDEIQKAQNLLNKAHADDAVEIAKRVANQAKAMGAMEQNDLVLKKLAEFLPVEKR